MNKLHTKFNKHFTKKEWNNLDNKYNSLCFTIEHLFYVDNLIKGGHFYAAMDFMNDMSTSFEVGGFEYDDMELQKYKDKSVEWIRKDLRKRYKLNYLGRIGHYPHKNLYNANPNYAIVIKEFNNKLRLKEMKNYNLYKLRKRLLLSVYPDQNTDFFFLTLPKNFKNSGQEVPVDWMLKDLVLYLWKHNIFTGGWGEKEATDTYFITCNRFNQKDYKSNKIKDLKYHNHIKDLFKHIPEITIDNDLLSSINFHKKDLNIICKKLGLPKPSHKGAFKGNLGI